MNLLRQFAKWLLFALYSLDPLRMRPIPMAGWFTLLFLAITLSPVALHSTLARPKIVNYVSFATANHLNPEALNLETNCGNGDEITMDIFWAERGGILAQFGKLPMLLRRINPDGHTWTQYVEKPLLPQFPLSQLLRPGHHMYKGLCIGDGQAAELTIDLGLGLERIDGLDSYVIQLEDQRP
jgi:hypothetical protein